MITHYLKVAFCNLLKYRTQSLFSILGLAIGFACFALANLWIRHEMTYDTFHDGADRIYRIRKVNGATIKDILNIFAKEYTTLLVIASVVAFPIGYALMKPWLQNYTLQTSISGWLYATIFLGIACVIALSIGLRVWKAANENPADVVKSE